MTPRGSEEEDFEHLKRIKTRLLRALKKAEAWMDSVGSGVESDSYARVMRQASSAIDDAEQS
jgi:hypothetical protein